MAKRRKDNPGSHRAALLELLPCDSAGALDLPRCELGQLLAELRRSGAGVRVTLRVERRTRRA